MLIISMATTYWLQWVVPNPDHGTNLTNFQGLVRHCWELRNNVTDELIKDGCQGWFDEAPPGKSYLELSCSKLVRSLTDSQNILLQEN